MAAVAMTTYRQLPPRVEAEVFDPAAGLLEGMTWLSDAKMSWWAVEEEDLHDECGQAYGQHGWVGSQEDGAMLCPGGYLVRQNGELRGMPASAFEAQWEPV